MSALGQGGLSLYLRSVEPARATMYQVPPKPLCHYDVPGAGEFFVITEVVGHAGFMAVPRVLHPAAMFAMNMGTTA